LAPSLFQTLRWCLSWLLFQLFFLRIASRSWSQFSGGNLSHFFDSKRRISSVFSGVFL
jgi:hypothetical protein